MPTTVLTPKEACEKLRIGHDKLRELVATKRIPHMKLGYRTFRFREQDLEVWMANKVTKVKQ